MSRVFNAGADESLALCFDRKQKGGSLLGSGGSKFCRTKKREDVVLGGCGGGKAREARGLDPDEVNFSGRRGCGGGRLWKVARGLLAGEDTH